MPPAGGAADLASASWGEAPAEPLPLALAHEDAAILVVDKPAGLVMHPAPGNPRGTLVNALLHHDPALREVPRAGVVHRLDKETSGLCVVARTLVAHTHLVRQLQAREMGREYLAVVLGDPAGQGTVEAPIARHPKERKRMAVVGGGRHAVSRYRVLERFAGCALVAVRLETGRTPPDPRAHDARRPPADRGPPSTGGGARRRCRGRSPASPSSRGFARQALHAARLTLVHPDDGAERTFESPLPADVRALLAALRRMGEGAGGGGGGEGVSTRGARGGGGSRRAPTFATGTPCPSSGPTGRHRLASGRSARRGRAASARRPTGR